MYKTPNPKYLWMLILTYTMVIIFSNWFDARFVKIVGFTIDSGTLIFPFTYLLSDMMTEVYGYKNTRVAIWCGLLFNIIFILYGQLIIHLPSPSFANNNACFDSLFALNIRVIMASGASYFISEPINALMMARLKIILKGNYIGLRFILSSLIASGVGSITFSLFAFYGVMGNNELVTLMVTVWIIMFFIEMIGLPISIRITNKLKAIEQLDIYDNNTNFNIFSLDNRYTENDNKFNK